MGAKRSCWPDEAPKVNLARDRRDGDRQGLAQRHGGEADEGIWCVQLHPGEETEGAAEMDGQAGGTTSDVREPAAGARRARQEFTAAARRVGGAQLRGLLRDGRDTALPSARTGNILRRQLIDVGGFNLSLILRKMLGGACLGSGRTAAARSAGRCRTSIPCARGPSHDP